MLCRRHRLTTFGIKLALELSKLAHEVHVRGDDAAAHLDEVVSLVERYAVAIHEIRDADRRRATDPRLAVNEHLAVQLTSLFCQQNTTWMPFTYFRAL